jgi:DNA helicase-2/ATP-dependent DNA helicase PcrA
MDELNAAQREAVTSPPGPMLVLAGAGTGKTKTLACRVAWLVDQGASPDRILLLTFTRRAASEMLSRAARFIGESRSARVWGGTFHSVASRLLRHHGRSIGLDPGFSVIDQEDSADLLDLIRSDLDLGSTKKRFPRKSTLVAIYSRVVNSRKPLSQVLADQFPWCVESADDIRAIFEAFTKRKREQAVLDYDDLLLYWHAMLQIEPVASALATQFDHVLVDEYQDTNQIQAQIVRGMRRDIPSVMVVGDDAQAIYSFRSATIDNILNFPQQFDQTHVVKLEENYRSTQPILDVGNRVMSWAKHQHPKSLRATRSGGGKPLLITPRDETEQSARVATSVLEFAEQGVELRRQAVLFRTGHHSDALEIELQKRNIPFIKYGGLKFVEAAHVKDVIAMLRLATNPGDEASWFRVLQLLEGVGPAAARKTIQSVLADKPSAARTRLKSSDHPVPAAAREQFSRLASLIVDCEGPRLTPADVVERVRSFYEPIFNDTYDNASLRIRDIEQLELIARSYTSLQQFVTDLALDPPASTQDHAGAPLKDDDYLVLSTIHSAKGCEWDVVHLLHAVDGNIPADMACGSEAEIEEERRLFYVACTRAKDHLHIYAPLRYYFKNRGTSDRHSYAQITRFLRPQDMPLFERLGSTQEQVEVTVTPLAGVATVKVDDVLSGLWK